MNVLLQPFEGQYSSENIKPGKYELVENTLIHPAPDYIITRNTDGSALSYYGDDIWNFTLLSTGIVKKFYFSKIDDSVQREEVKRLFFLVLLLKPGKEGASPSTKTLHEYLGGCLLPLNTFANSLQLSIVDVLSDSQKIKNYIKNFCTSKSRVKTFLSFLNFLYEQNNQYTGIAYQRDQDIINMLSEKRHKEYGLNQQTEVIPRSIFNKSITQRWEQITEFEEKLPVLLKFITKHMKFQGFAATKQAFDQNHYYVNFSEAKEWTEAVEEAGLTDFFNKYKVLDRGSIRGLIKRLQGTCKHLIHAYSGMRHSEVLSLKNNCLETTEDYSATRLLGITTKFSGSPKATKWVTSKEITRVIAILNTINNTVAGHFKIKPEDLPLFIRTSYLAYSAEVDENIYKKTTIYNYDELQLDMGNITITEQDIEELEAIEYIRDWRNEEEFKIGSTWNFKSHQYRRSLAVYAIQSGLVSLGSLQKQFKHLFKEMTLYYGNGSSYAKKLFDIPKDHIANDIDKLKPEIEALLYFREVLFSDERLYGAHGAIVEDHIKPKIKDQKVYLLENREKTEKKFIKGETAFSDTAVGGCLATHYCSSRLTRSFIACFGCEDGYQKKSKVLNAIEEQKIYINTLDPNSIEYRSEIEDLEVLEKNLKIMENKNAV